MALPAIIGAAARAGGAAAGAGGSGGAAGAMRAAAQLSQIQMAISQVGNTSHRAANLIGSLAGAITGSLTKALTGLISVVDTAAAPIESLVRIANPAIANAFGVAMRDAYGVIGRMLLPVMESFIGVARKVGDVFAGLEPVFQPAMKAIAELVAVVGDEFARSIAKQAPVIELLANVITKVAQAASVAARILGEVARAFGGLWRMAARLLGFDGSTFDRKASAVGAAARQAHFVAPKQISDDALKNALSQGVGRKPDKNLGDVVTSIEQFHNWAVKRWGQVDAAKNAIERGGGAGAAVAAAGTAGSAPGTGENTGAGTGSRAVRAKQRKLDMHGRR